MDYKILFLDPHASGVGVNLVNRFYTTPNFSKLFFFSEGMAKGDISSLVYCGSSFALGRVPMPIILNRIISVVEFFLWRHYNNIFSNYIIASLSKKIECNIIIDSNIPFRGREKYLEKLYKQNKNIRFIFYVSHIHFNTEEKIKLFKKFPNSLFFSESRPIFKDTDSKKIINKNNFFHCSYGVNKKFFSLDNILKNRGEKILVTGSILETKGNESIELFKYFGSESIHKDRGFLFKNKNKLNYLFNNIAEYYIPGSVNNYFKHDIVKQYGSHKYFICPEDATGMPSVNMLEGMAMGCVYFGNINYTYFEEYKMEEWVHFIPHNGSIKSIESAFYRVQNDPELFKKIQDQGALLVRSKYSMKSTYKRFESSLKLCLKRN
jgi:hypothetical protein